MLSRNLQVSFLVESLLHHADAWTPQMLQELTCVPGSLFETMMEKLIKNPNGREMSIALLPHLGCSRMIHLASLDIVRCNSELVGEMARVVFSQWSLTEQKKLKSESKSTFDLLQESLIENPRLFLLIKNFDLISAEIFFRALYSFRFIEDSSQLGLFVQHLESIYPRGRGIFRPIGYWVKDKVFALFDFRRHKSSLGMRGVKEQSVDSFLRVCSRKMAKPLQKWCYALVDFFWGSPNAWFESQMQALLRNKSGTIRVLSGLRVNPVPKKVESVKHQSNSSTTQGGPKSKMLEWSVNKGSHSETPVFNTDEEMFPVIEAYVDTDEKELKTLEY